MRWFLNDNKAFAEQDEPDCYGETYDFFKDFCIGENSFITLSNHFKMIDNQHFVHESVGLPINGDQFPASQVLILFLRFILILLMQAIRSH